MKELERRLREDAAAIRADVDPTLQARIRASVAATTPHRPPVRPRPVPGLRRWALGAAGAAAVAAAALFLPRPDAPPPEFSATPSAARGAGDELPIAALRTEFALFELPKKATRPLEEEQRNLETDLERIRDELKRSF